MNATLYPWAGKGPRARRTGGFTFIFFFSSIHGVPILVKTQVPYFHLQVIYAHTQGAFL